VPGIDAEVIGTDLPACVTAAVMDAEVAEHRQRRAVGMLHRENRKFGIDRAGRADDPVAASGDGLHAFVRVTKRIRPHTALFAEKPPAGDQVRLRERGETNPRVGQIVMGLRHRIGNPRCHEFPVALIRRTRADADDSRRRVRVR